MVISSNPKPDQSAFSKLLNETVAILESNANSKPETYLKLLGRDLESTVVDIMSEKARGTDFENTIELISGQRFPDIIAKKYYGVEVKTTKQNHWITTGNSIMEGTRIDGIERIYLLFGKMVEPIMFKCRPYEDCLSDVVITHSPRYQINMELEQGNTIFDKLEIPYDQLRQESNPFKPIVDYYRKSIEPGEDCWWLDNSGEKWKGLIIKLWNNVSPELRQEYRSKAIILFPELFSGRQDKYNRLTVWLVNLEGVVCKNIRDAFTAGGQGYITWNGRLYDKLPRIIVNLAFQLPQIESLLRSFDEETLSHYWEQPIENRTQQWINLVVSNTGKLPLDLGAYLRAKMNVTL